MTRSTDTNPSDRQQVESIRAASRTIVRELGFMRATLAGTRLSISTVHALLALGERGTLTAAELSEILNLEKSSISRMVRKLIQAEEIEERPSPADARAKLLSLTARGQASLAGIEAFGRAQVETALSNLPAGQRRLVAEGLQAYATALSASRRARRTRLDRGEAGG